MTIEETKKKFAVKSVFGIIGAHYTGGERITSLI
jgi:hypothetical protein